MFLGGHEVEGLGLVFGMGLFCMGSWLLGLEQNVFELSLLPNKAPCWIREGS